MALLASPITSPARPIPRYFEDAGSSRRVTSAAVDWGADLPPDVLRAIVEATGDPCPAKFAGVCRGWRWLLDDASLRRTLTFAPRTTSQAALVRALRSFSLFVCCRAPVTTELVFDVWLPTRDHPATPYIAATAASVLAHLAGALEGVALQGPHASHGLASSPFLDLCDRVHYLRCTVAADLELAEVASLRFLDLVLDGRAARRLTLPDSLASLRARVTEDADPAVLTSLLGELPFLHCLTTLRLSTEHTCEIDADSLPPTLSTLVISGEVPLHLVVPPEASPPPNLEVLSLDHCRVSALNLARFLAR